MRVPLERWGLGALQRSFRVVPDASFVRRKCESAQVNVWAPPTRWHRRKRRSLPRNRSRAKTNFRRNGAVVREPASSNNQGHVANKQTKTIDAIAARAIVLSMASPKNGAGASLARGGGACRPGGFSCRRARGLRILSLANRNKKSRPRRGGERRRTRHPADRKSFHSFRFGNLSMHFSDGISIRRGSFPHFPRTLKKGDQ